MIPVTRALPSKTPVPFNMEMFASASSDLHIGFASALDLTVDLAAGGVTEAVKENLSRLPNMDMTSATESKPNTAPAETSAIEEKSLLS